MRSGALPLLALLAISPACRKPGSGLVQLEIEAAPPVPALESVEVSVTTAETQDPTAPALNRQTLPWQPAAGGKLAIGLYVPASVSGWVWVNARGLMGSKAIARAAPRRVAVRPGQVSELVTLALAAGAEPAPSSPPTPDASPDGPPDAAATERPPPDAGAPVQSTWTAPEKIENDPLDRAYDTSVAVDPITGDALVVIVERQVQIKTLRYDATARRWGAPQVLATGGRLGYAAVAMAPTRAAFVVWTERGMGPTSAGVWESHSGDAGATWSPPARIYAGVTCINTSLAAGRNGRARVAWEESVDSYNIVRSAYHDGSAWSPAATPLDSTDFFSERRPRVLMDPGGDGFVIWMQPEPMSPRFSARAYAARFAGAAFDPPRVLDIHPGSVNHPVSSAMSPDGRGAVVVWKQNYEGGGTDYLATVWSAASGWTAPARAADQNVDRTAVVMDDAGAATLVYEAVLTTATRNTVAVRREPGQAWGAPMPLETDNLSPPGNVMEGDHLSPAATVDRQGQVQVAWRKGRAAQVYGLSTRRFVPGKGWDPEIVVAVRDKLAVSAPALATTDGGRSLLSWVYLDPTGGGMDPDVYSVFVSFSP